MNTKFNLSWISHLAGRPNRGFALPLVMMCGLVIAVVGATVVMMGMEDNNKVVSKAKTAQAEAAAEAGVTQYTNFINGNRRLATYPDCVADRNSNGSCPDSGTSTLSWANAVNSGLIPTTVLQSGNTCTNYTASGGSASASTVASVWANGTNSSGWKTAGSGQYKIAGYKYTADGSPNTAPGTAVLAVQGRSGDGDNDGQSQIQVTMRINTLAGSPPPIPQTNTPGLWARSFNTGANVHAHVLDSSGCTSGNTAFPSSEIAAIPAQPIGTLPNGNHTPPLSTTMGTVTRDTNGTPFPPLPYYPTSSEFTSLVAANKVNELTSCPSTRTSYPSDGDKDANGNVFNASSPPSTGRVYKYRITGGCTLPSGVTFGSRGDDRIIMYVDSTLDIGNNARIATTGGTQAKVQWLLRTADLDLGGNSQVGSASPDASTAKNWSFFLYSCTDFACATRKSSPVVSLRGTPDYYAFIFAPYANADMRGNPKIAGALWVNSYQTNGNPPKVFQAIFTDDFNNLFSSLYADTGTDLSSLVPTNSIGNVVSYTKTAFGAPVVASAVPGSSPSSQREDT